MQKIKYAVFAIILTLVIPFAVDAKAISAPTPTGPAILTASFQSISHPKSDSVYRLAWKASSATSYVNMTFLTVSGVSVVGLATGEDRALRTETLRTAESLGLLIENGTLEDKVVTVFLDPYSSKNLFKLENRKILTVTIPGSKTAPVIETITPNTGIIPGMDIVIQGRNFLPENYISFESVASSIPAVYGGATYFSNIKPSKDGKTLTIRIPKTLAQTSEEYIGSREVSVVSGTYQIGVQTKNGKSNIFDINVRVGPQVISVNTVGSSFALASDGTVEIPFSWSSVNPNQYPYAYLLSVEQDNSNPAGGAYASLSLSYSATTSGQATGFKNIYRKIVPGQYKIVVCDTATDIRKPDCGMSSMFKITPVPQKGSQVYSPNGGETLYRDTDAIFSWTSESRVSFEDSLLYVREVNASTTYFIGSPSFDTDNFTWKVGKDADGNTVPDGKYVFRFCVLGSCDESDSFFTIISSTPKPDLRIHDLTCTPDSPKVGELIACELTILNAGSVKTTNPFRILIAGGGISNGNIVSEVVDPIDVNKKRVVPFSLAFSGIGNNVFNISVDYINNIDELSETNNAMVKIVSIKSDLPSKQVVTAPKTRGGGGGGGSIKLK